MKFSRAVVACTATAVVAVTASAAIPALAANGPAASLTGTPPIVYQGKFVNQHIVLGPQYAPTLLVRTPALPAGTYLVTATVGAVIASHDQIVCAVSNVPHGNDGVFGTAGNPGTGGIYGTAAMTDTVTASAGQHISITCNSFNYGNGTYVGSAVVEALPIAHVN